VGVTRVWTPLTLVGLRPGLGLATIFVLLGGRGPGTPAREERGWWCYAAHGRGICADPVALRMDATEAHRRPTCKYPRPRKFHSLPSPAALPFLPLPPFRLLLRARPRVHRLRRHPRAHAGAPPARPRRQLAGIPQTHCFSSNTSHFPSTVT
jgi:hypothetical protein